MDDDEAPLSDLLRTAYARSVTAYARCMGHSVNVTIHPDTSEPLWNASVLAAQCSQAMGECLSLLGAAAPVSWHEFEVLSAVPDAIVGSDAEMVSADAHVVLQAMIESVTAATVESLPYVDLRDVLEDYQETLMAIGMTEDQWI